MATKDALVKMGTIKLYIADCESGMTMTGTKILKSDSLVDFLTGSRRRRSSCEWN